MGQRCPRHPLAVLGFVVCVLLVVLVLVGAFIGCVRRRWWPGWWGAGFGEGRGFGEGAGVRSPTGAQAVFAIRPRLWVRFHASAAAFSRSAWRSSRAAFTRSTRAR